MKSLSLFLGLLFAVTHTFAQEPTNTNSSVVEYQFRNLAGDVTVVRPDQPVERRTAPPLRASNDESILPEEVSAETPPSMHASESGEISIEDIDREMALLVSKLPQEQRESIRKSNGDMYDFVPSASSAKGRPKIKTRRIIRIMPASAQAVPISAADAYNEGIRILLYEIYKTK